MRYFSYNLLSGGLFTLAACTLLLLGTGCGQEKIVQKAKNTTQVPGTPAPTPAATYSVGLPGLIQFIPTLKPLPNSAFTPILSIAAPAHGVRPTNWCQAYGDALTRAEADQRLAWAKHCTPEFADVLAAATQARLYPSYGRVGEDNQPINILNYKAPVTAVATCDLPLAYVVVAICAPFP